MRSRGVSDSGVKKPEHYSQRGMENQSRSSSYEIPYQNAYPQQNYPNYYNNRHHIYPYNRSYSDLHSERVPNNHVYSTRPLQQAYSYPGTRTSNYAPEQQQTRAMEKRLSPLQIKQLRIISKDLSLFKRINTEGLESLSTTELKDLAQAMSISDEELNNSQSSENSFSYRKYVHRLIKKKINTVCTSFIRYTSEKDFPPAIAERDLVSRCVECDLPQSPGNPLLYCFARCGRCLHDTEECSKSKSKHDGKAVALCNECLCLMAMKKACPNEFGKISLSRKNVNTSAVAHLPQSSSSSQLISHQAPGVTTNSVSASAELMASYQNSVQSNKRLLNEKFVLQHELEEKKKKVLELRRKIENYADNAEPEAKRRKTIPEFDVLREILEKEKKHFEQYKQKAEDEIRDLKRRAQEMDETQELLQAVKENENLNESLKQMTQKNENLSRNLNLAQKRAEFLSHQNEELRNKVKEMAFSGSSKLDVQEFLELKAQNTALRKDLNELLKFAEVADNLADDHKQLTEAVGELKQQKVFKTKIELPQYMKNRLSNRSLSGRRQVGILEIENREIRKSQIYGFQKSIADEKAGIYVEEVISLRRKDPEFHLYYGNKRNQVLLKIYMTEEDAKKAHDFCSRQLEKKLSPEKFSTLEEYISFLDLYEQLRQPALFV
eukprot:maker-scaffold_12-snap-gene-6.37-mRNA-1 protein AED:0.00 eAED:0.00 QI:51/1/1/1/1/1/3/207/663